MHHVLRPVQNPTEPNSTRVRLETSDMSDIEHWLQPLGSAFVLRHCTDDVPGLPHFNGDRVWSARTMAQLIPSTHRHDSRRSNVVSRCSGEGSHVSYKAASAAQARRAR